MNTKPSIILVRPQMGENIGAAARAMLNFGLDKLRIVAPRDGWPNPKANDMAAGALEVVKQAQIFESVEEAVADIHYLYATTARMRDKVKPVISSRKFAEGIFARDAQSGIMFGPEKSGLSNEDLVLADAIVTVPVSAEYPSLNLAQAVAVLSYEWFAQDAEIEETGLNELLASKEELTHLFAHLEEELDVREFFRVPEKKPVMWENIRNAFVRAEMTEQEVRTLRGVIRCLSGEKNRK